MIAGIGVDIVDIARVEALLSRYGNRFLARVFTEGEAGYAMSCARPAERLAGRFAVKEAVMKALGTGKSHGILWKDIETVRARGGRPTVRLYGNAANLAKQKGNASVHVTIAHDGGKAVAFVVLESGETG